jgi:hypothetical protein
VSDAQSRVLRAQAALRKRYAELRTALVEVMAATVPQGDRLRIFVTSVLLPRVEALNRVLGSAVSGYLGGSSGSGASGAFGRGGDAHLRAEERRANLRGPDALARAVIRPRDAIAYRLRDDGVVIMYALKALRLAAQLGALRVAQGAYMETYTRVVLAEGGRPPPLSRMLYTFLCVDATVQLVVLLALVLVGYCVTDPRDPESRKFVLDDEFIATFLADYLASTAALATLGLLLGGLVRRKQYFNLATAGSGTVQAYRAMLASSCAVVAAVPFFLLL